MSAPHPTEPAAVELAAVLARAELFAVLAEVTRHELAAACRWRRVEAGRRIFARGDAGSVMYVVVDGAVALSVSTARGDEVIFDVLRPVATFGELSLIDGGARIASATAHQASMLASVPAAAIQRLLRVDPGFALAMLTALAKMVRRVDDRLADQTLLDLRTRLIKYLSSVAGPAAGTAAGPSEISIDLPLTQAHLARLVGGSRQQVNRIIVDLERCGAIRRQGAEIVAITPRAMLESRIRR